MLRSRITKIEKQLRHESGGIPSWAVKIAMDKARFAQQRYEIMRAVAAARRLIGHDHPDPDPPKVWTREEILAYADELSEKYQSVMQYCADIKPMNFADIKNKRRF
jgi:hypothetical protein